MNPRPHTAFFADLRRLLRLSGFRRLFAVRLVSQGADGIFQVGLASFVLFSPERAPTASAIALGFAALLLPFSVLGPFAGVFLDRWPRRATLTVSNLVRVGLLAVVAGLVAADVDGLPFFVVVLACLSVNRFLLAGLSASLPHVVGDRELVMANGVSPTCGTLAAVAGAGLGGLVHLFAGNVVVIGLAAAGYLTAGLLATRLPFVGPDARPADDVEVGTAARNVLVGLVDGLRHIPRPAALALGAVGASRLFYGITTVATVLLYRNYFPDSDGDSDVGLVGIGLVVLASGVGFGVAAVATPTAVRRMRPQSWQVVLLTGAGVVQVIPMALYVPAAVVASAFGLGVASQGVKICTDTLVQTNVADEYRGRVFSLYDVMFNVVFVAAAALAAVVLPDTGKSYVVLFAGAAGYLLVAMAYRRLDSAGRVDPAGRDDPEGRVDPAARRWRLRPPARSAP